MDNFEQKVETLVWALSRSPKHVDDTLDVLRRFEVNCERQLGARKPNKTGGLRFGTGDVARVIADELETEMSKPRRAA